MNIREIAYEFTSRAGADDIWDRVIIQMEAALRHLLAQAVGVCAGRAETLRGLTNLDDQYRRGAENEAAVIIGELTDFDKETDQNIERRTQSMLDICYKWTRDELSDEELKNRFARMLHDYATSAVEVAEIKKADEVGYDWTFETAEQIGAFLMYVRRIQQKPGEMIGVVCVDVRNILKVVTQTATARRLAQAFQFGWMANKDTEQRHTPDGEDEETRGNRLDRHEVRFKDGSRHEWLIVLWRSGRDDDRRSHMGIYC